MCRLNFLILQREECIRKIIKKSCLRDSFSQETHMASTDGIKEINIVEIRQLRTKIKFA